MSRRARRSRRDDRLDRHAGLLSRIGWGIVLLGLVGYFANEFTIDLPAVHYGMYAVMLGGAYVGFRFLR
jgi:hypothetical protein